MTLSPTTHDESTPIGLFDRQIRSAEATNMPNWETLTAELDRPQILGYEIPGGLLWVSLEGAVPTWVFEAIDRVVYLLYLPPNWDSFGALPISQDIALSVLPLFPRITSVHTPEPYIGPTDEGSVLLAWHKEDMDLEIEFLSPDDFLVSFRHGNEENEWPLNVQDDLTRLAEIVRRFS